MCVLTAFSLPFSNYPPTPPSNTALSDLQSFFLSSNSFLSAFLILFHSLFIGPVHLSYNRVYFCDNPHYCRGLSLFSERVPISLYNTPNPCTLWFWITWSFCASLNLWIKELLDWARQKLCITVCRSWLGFSCLRWMTIGLTSLLGPQGGKWVCVCLLSFLVGTRGSVTTRNGLVFVVFFRHT